MRGAGSGELFSGVPGDGGERLLCAAGILSVFGDVAWGLRSVGGQFVGRVLQEGQGGQD